jgi:hypothetical protein
VLRDSLDDYLKNREAFARSEGILARDRKPLSLSFNWFILHPFGRDYRQGLFNAFILSLRTTKTCSTASHHI